MNISKALKIKNRLVGEVKRLQKVLTRENSRNEFNVSKVDAAAVFKDLQDTVNKLVILKGAISRASAPIAEQLALLAETKSEIAFLATLPTKEGKEVNMYDSKQTSEWTAYLNQEKLDDVIRAKQTLIEVTQDSVDTFNATAEVNYSL